MTASRDPDADPRPAPPGTAPTGVAIRAALPEDLGRVAELRWRWSVDEGGVDPVTEIAGYADAVVAFAAAHPGTHRCFVAERDGSVVGMAWIAYTGRPPTPDDLSRVSADVQSVYVLPGLRGSGTGSALLATLLADARDRGCRHVSVHSSTRAVPLYARAGFAVDETLRIAVLGADAAPASADVSSPPSHGVGAASAPSRTASSMQRRRAGERS
jgi:GNAT superfamily N-acetyltransferase